MVKSASQHMVDFQEKLVEAALYQAFTAGRHFENIDQIDSYFRSVGFNVNFEKHARQVFETYLRVKDQCIKPPTPNEPQSNIPGDNFRVGDGAQLENTEAIPPRFADEEVFPITYWRPRRGEYALARARRCEGKTCLISRDTIDRHQLTIQSSSRSSSKNNDSSRTNDDHQYTFLQWREIHGPGEVNSHTWFRIVEPDILPGCEVAIGEEPETQAREGEPPNGGGGGEGISSEDDGEASEDVSTDEIEASRPNGMAMYGFGDDARMAIPLFRPHEQAEIVQITADMNLQAAMSLAGLKRKAQMSAAYGGGGGSQLASPSSKCTRTASDGSKASGMQGNGRSSVR